MLPSYVDVSVRGYTDNQPLPKDSAFRDNIDLSNQRAVSVVHELIKNGVSADRLSTAGFGSSKPIAPNNNEENRVIAGRNAALNVCVGRRGNAVW